MALTEVDVIAAALDRLDQRVHVTPARLELSHEMPGRWLAQVIADPAMMPMSAWGNSPHDALAGLAGVVERYDWRRVRGRRARADGRT